MKNIQITIYILLLSILFFSEAKAEKNKLHIYCWADEIPHSIIKDFSKEYGIKVSLTSFDNNETMYSKVKLLGPNSDYDIICPSSYYVKKMKNESLIQEVDKTQVPNLKNISTDALNKEFDQNNRYSLPYVMTQTGILYNSQYIKENINSWNDLFNHKYKNKILLLDDIREVFSIAFLLLGYNINNVNKNEIEEAYIKLKTLMPNVKIFSAELLKIPYITEEVIIGMNWNAEAYTSIQENPDLKFIYPKEGAILALDNFVISKYSKNIENAYKFINYIYEAQVAKKIIEEIWYNVPNSAAKVLLPEKLRNNKIIFPDKKTLANGIFQEDLGQSITLYEKLWSKLKAGA